MIDYAKRIQDLCYDNNVTITQLFKSIGVSRNTYYALKYNKHTGMRMSTIEKIADYFGITSDEFLQGAPARRVPPDGQMSSAEDVLSILQELKDRPELKTLFKSARGASPDQIFAVSKLLDSMKGGDDDGNEPSI